MEFGFDCQNAMSGGCKETLPNGASIIVIHGEDVSYPGGQVTQIIDSMGDASAEA